MAANEIPGAYTVHRKDLSPWRFLAIGKFGFATDRQPTSQQLDEDKGTYPSGSFITPHGGSLLFGVYTLHPSTFKKRERSGQEKKCHENRDS